jgi:hypothetical protein
MLSSIVDFTSSEYTQRRLQEVANVCVLVFLISVLWIMVANPIMFGRRHGRRHSTNGLIYFLWISLGFTLHIKGLDLVSAQVFDAVLGGLGTCLALTAAFDFGHKNVVNVASGTLDEHATVTYNEMIEHSFYQGLNLVQAMYLHSVGASTSRWHRFLLLFAVTAPWFVRGMFPVNRFSDNYTKVDVKSTNVIRAMYRIKKYQYVFYKHFLLHGLNLSVAVHGYELANRPDFRLYWLLLNLSYVMEFFLQTLVKKKYMTQRTMLALQVVLMTAASIAALYVLRYVNITLAVVSLVLNFTNRGHDLFNTMAALAFYFAVSEYRSLLLQ